MFLSGSGSTILLVSNADVDFSNEFDEMDKLKNEWKILSCKVDNEGATVYGTI